MVGVEEPDSGTVVRGRNLDIRYLPQNPRFVAGDTIIESILRDNEGHPHLWDMESQAKTMLTKVGIFDFDAKVETLSGGQKKRVALVSTLMADTDLLVLDEPTNHLDSEMADWLEEHLKKFRGAILMITHDRYFLDSVANRIVELDKGKFYSYQANYEGYLKLRAERLDMALASERKRQSILKVELEWMQRGARARSTKQKAHIQRYESLRNQKGPEFDKEVEMESISSRLGRTTVEIQDLCKAYGEKVLIKDFSYIFLKNDRIGIIGPNGSGKSTLMKMIAGWVEPDSGSIEIGQTVKMGYFSQENEAMDESLKVIDYIRNVAEYVQTKDGSISASQMLERFLFPSSVQYTTISRLSGGEKRRLYLLRILMDAPNVLLLDEPTNDLDIRTLTILEDYLDSFQGIVITVSHDRYFLDRMVRRIFAFEGCGNVVQYEGGFTDYQAAVIRKQAEGGSGVGSGQNTAGGRGTGGNQGIAGNRGAGGNQGTAGGHGAGGSQGDGSGQQRDADLENKPSRKTWGGPKKLKFTYQEQKDWEVIESEIEKLEEDIAALEGQIESAARDFVKLKELMDEKERREEELEIKMERWMYLNDLAEKIAEENRKK